MFDSREEARLKIPDSVIEDSINVRDQYTLAEAMNMIVTTSRHLEIYNLIMNIVQDNSSYNFNIREGKTLNVGLQTKSIVNYRLSETKEFLDPLDNLVYYLRREGIHAFGISPECKDSLDWNEIGLFKGLAQNMSFEDNSFNTLLSFGFLDESYPKLYNMTLSTPNFYTETANEFKRVLEPNGRCILAGGPVPEKALKAFSAVGFEINNLFQTENWIVYLRNND